MWRNLSRRLSLAFVLLMVVSNAAIGLTASEIAAKFRDKYLKTQNFSADFVETTIVAGKQHTGKGRVYFQKPDLLRKENLDPANPGKLLQLIVSDGNVVWSYTPLIKQVTKQKLTHDKANMELLPGFGASMENVEKNYILTLKQDEVAEKSGSHLVELVPKRAEGNPGASFDIMQVWIRDSDSLPTQFLYKNKKKETVLILSFKNIKINQDLPKSTFKFEVPKGVQVITVPSR